MLLSPQNVWQRFNKELIQHLHESEYKYLTCFMLTSLLTYIYILWILIPQKRVERGQILSYICFLTYTHHSQTGTCDIGRISGKRLYWQETQFLQSYSWLVRYCIFKCNFIAWNSNINLRIRLVIYVFKTLNNSNVHTYIYITNSMRDSREFSLPQK